ncbi:tetratricopeptide repeat protein [Spirosoma linguale]|uniref:Tetratricopeptide repeat protein n=1 Tax=Spirosoma linguale (strain ATCC 33905 / DSM 74 / LMG 10896 / Claus 1) TaxID=504472 RepID=D2QUF0_SPILD|nr:hypothetical protein Slin_6475 [Spirosoma linguale DSM 74]
MRILLFSLLLLVCGNAAIAQTAKILDLERAQWFIKLGNTLREAKQYSQARQFLEDGLKGAQAAKNTYWTAAAYENLGLLFRDRNDASQASYYLNRALNLYQTGRIGGMSAKVIKQILGSFKNEQELYGGIDVGAKGVKLSIIALKFSSDGRPEFKVLRSESKNTNPATGTAAAFKETTEVVRLYLVDSLQKGRKLPANRIFVVGSSGLKTELDKQQKASDFLQQLHTGLGATWPDPVSFINAATEAELTVRGTIPESEWMSTAVMDIGSGNTKGGYFTSANTFEYTDYLGTGAMMRYIQESGKPVTDAAQSVYENEVRTAVSRDIGRKPEFQNRKRIYMLGGIVYALTTYLYPREINSPMVQFSYKDVVKLQEMAIKNYDVLTNPDLSGFDSDELYKKAQAEVRNVRERVFKRDELIAGATLLRGILEECRQNDPDNKEFVFHRNGVIGWISGYIIRKKEEEFKAEKDGEYQASMK